MNRSFKLVGVLTIILVTIIIISFRLLITRQRQDDKIRIGIKITNENQRQTLKEIIPNLKDIDRAEYLEFTTRWKEFFILQNNGLEPELVFDVNKRDLIDSRFYQLSQVDSILEALHQRFHAFTRIEKIGESAFYQFPVKGIKLSNSLAGNESKPSILITAAHHGNELLGVNICLYILDFLCSNYSRNVQVKNWIDNSLIWIIPVVNPDGYNLVMDNDHKMIWRKNLRDNNGDGQFTPELDGVDLNRNYDFNWAKHGDQFPNSNYYPGPFPFSEPETRAIRDLARRENFQYHLDFHSSGEMILYPGKLHSSIEDENKIITFARELANNITKQCAISKYGIAPLNINAGQCALWMYDEIGALSVIVEAGNSFFPEQNDLDRIIEENARAAFWLFDHAVKMHNKKDAQSRQAF